MTQDQKWMSMRDAVSLLASEHGGDIQAKHIIADRIRDGIILVRAGLVTDKRAMSAEVSWRKPITIADPTGVYTPLERDLLIGSSIWLASTDWSADVSSWRWGEGSMVVNYAGEGDLLRRVYERQPSKPAMKPKSAVLLAERRRSLPEPRDTTVSPARSASRHRIQMWNVTLSLPCAEPMTVKPAQIEPKPNDHAATPKRSPAGRRRDLDWYEWVAELVKYIHDGGKFVGLSAPGLVGKIDTLMEKRVLKLPGDDGRLRAAQAVLKRLGDPPLTPD